MQNALLVGRHCTNLFMKFKQRLDVAVRRGHVQIKGNKLYVPNAKNMRTIFPGIKSCRYSAVKRAMWRNGYMLRDGLWEGRTNLGPNNLHRPCPVQNVSRRQFAPRVLLAAV